MANAFDDDVMLTKRGTAKIVAALVQTINESDPTFQDRFLRRLTALRYIVRDNELGEAGNDPNIEGELLTWVRAYLTGWSMIDGQGEPLLKSYRPGIDHMDAGT